jgi:uncharacterized membrane protein
MTIDNKSLIERASKQSAYILLLIATLIFFSLFLGLSIKIHGVFGTSAYDLGLFDQAFWRYSQFLSNFNTVRGLNILGDHFSPIALIFAPLYWIYPDVTWAFGLQTFSVTIAGLFLFLIARHYLLEKYWAPLFIVIAYWAHPAVHNTLLWQYHEIVLASGLYMALIWCYIKNRFGGVIISLILLLACREDMPFTLFAFSLVAFLDRRWKYGFLIAITSILWWLTATKVAMPYFNEVGYFRSSNHGIGMVLDNLFNFSFYVDKFSDPNAQRYLILIAIPIGLIGLFSPYLLIPAIPTLMANILIGGYNTIPTYHYSVSIMPFVFWAALASIGRASNTLQACIIHKKWRTVQIAGFLLVSSGFIAANYSVVSIRNLPDSYNDYYAHKDRRDHLHSIDQEVAEHGVAASDFLVPHLSHREHIYLFPNPWKVHVWGINGENPHHPNQVQYIILDKNAVADNQDLYDYLTLNKLYTRISSKHGIIVLKRLKFEESDRDKAVALFRAYKQKNLQFSNIWISDYFQTTEQDFTRLDVDVSGAGNLRDGNHLIYQNSTLLDIDFNEGGSHDFTTRYLQAEVISPDTAVARMSLGSDDGVSVWLNGNLIHENIINRAAVLNDDEFDLPLIEGKNTLLFRVNNTGGAFRLLTALKLY